MQKSEMLRKLEIHEVLFRCLLFVITLILMSFYAASGTLAKYKSQNIASDFARVAKFGDLSFYEYMANGTTLITGNEAQVETIAVLAGKNIAKNISIAYSGNEIAVYVFFIIETNGWVINTNEDNTNTLSINNTGGEKMVTWTLNNTWTYLKNASNTSQYVFYHKVEANVDFSDSLMTELNVNSLSLDDFNLLRNPSYSLKFKTKAVSAFGVEPSEAWNYIADN